MNLSRYLSKQTVNILSKHSSFNKEDPEIIEYGLTIFFATILKFAVVFLLALSLGLLREIFLCAFVFGILRSFAGGVHAKTPLGCLISMIFVYFSVYLLASVIQYSNLLFWASLVFCLITLLAYAPAGTAEKPVLNKRQIKIMKLCSVLTLIIIYILTFHFFTEMTKNIIILSCIFECITLLPFVYTITKTERGDKYNEEME